MPKTGYILERAPAKVNLALHVLHQRPDGYHALDSLVAFVPQAADRVLLAPAQDFALRVTGPLAAGVPADDSNLALRAAHALCARWPERFFPVHITLEKHLPAAAGIGVGSADAAAVIRAMCRLYEAHPPREELQTLALALGADVPVCLHGRAVRMGGVGERLQPVQLPEGLSILLANPGVAVATADVFRRLAGARAQAGRKEGTGLPPMPSRPAPQAFMDYLHATRNDLQAPAMALAPAVARCLKALSALPAAGLVRMSGSGATCFALFTHRADAERAFCILRHHQPRWWCALGDVI